MNQPSDLPGLRRRLCFGGPVGFLALGFGSGLSAVAPGTMGTLVALPLTWCLAQLTWPWSLAILCVATGLGVWLCERAGAVLGVHDDKSIVWDEIVGMCWVTWWFDWSWSVLVLAFCAFRFFDILKPWPISWFDRECPGGLGVMLDDLMAAVYSFLIVFLVQHWFGLIF